MQSNKKRIIAVVLLGVFVNYTFAETSPDSEPLSETVDQAKINNADGPWLTLMRAMTEGKPDDYLLQANWTHQFGTIELPLIWPPDGHRGMYTVISVSEIARITPKPYDLGEFGATSVIRNIKLYESPNYDEATPVSFDASQFIEYAFEQHGQEGLPAEITVSDEGHTLTIQGNVWQRYPMEVTVTESTMMSFEMRIDSLAEIHFVGLDLDNSYQNDATKFKLFGTQEASASQFNTMEFNYPGDGQWQHYDIPLGTWFTGDFTHLIIGQDDDVRNDIRYGSTIELSSGSIVHVDVPIEDLTEKLVDYKFGRTPAFPFSVE